MRQRYRARRLSAAEHVEVAAKLRDHIADLIEFSEPLLELRRPIQQAHTMAHTALQRLQSRLDDEWFELPLAARQRTTQNGESPYYSQDDRLGRTGS